MSDTMRSADPNAHMHSTDAADHMPEGYRAQNLPMYEVSEKLKPLIEKYGLEQNVADMRDKGWTVITGVPLDLNDRIRETILELSADVGGGAAAHAFTRSLRFVLPKDPVFAEAATYPPLLVLGEYLLGARFVLSETLATVKETGLHRLGLHTDQALMPTPYPEHMGYFTACWVLDPWDEAHGATRVIPGSHELRRYPELDEARNPEGGIPIVAETGSIAIWGGFTWHDSYPRTVPGQRVVFHVGFARQCYTPNNDFRRLGKDYIASSPPALAGLLGDGLPYGSYNDEPVINESVIGKTVVDSRS